MFDEIDDLIERGVIHSVYVGKSVTRQARFATLRKGAGETVSEGKGQTAEEALRKAIDGVGKPRVQHQEPEVQQPMMPGMMTR